LMTIEAEVRSPIATAQLACFNLPGPADNLMRVETDYRLDLCLTPRPRNTRGCYRDHWSPHRFERIGQVFLLPPGQTIRARTDGGISQSSIVCHVRREAVGEWLDSDLAWTDDRLRASLDVADGNIRQLLLRLGQELQQPGLASHVMVELIAAQIALEIARYCASIEKVATVCGLAPWRLRLIDERLNEVRDAPTLSELAAICKLSVRHLTRGFRASRGQSIGEHVMQCRVDHAKRLLAGDRSVKAIAYAMGFASPSSFTFAFRRATGQTPREFRQRHRQT
jgi:AraC family transcriptional regulator